MKFYSFNCMKFINHYMWWNIVHKRGESVSVKLDPTFERLKPKMKRKWKWKWKENANEKKEMVG